VTHLDHYYYPLQTDMAKLIVGFCNFPLRTHQKGKVFKQRLFPCSGTTETWSEKILWKQSPWSSD